MQFVSKKNEAMPNATPSVRLWMPSSVLRIGVEYNLNGQQVR